MSLYRRSTILCVDLSHTVQPAMSREGLTTLQVHPSPSTPSSGSAVGSSGGTIAGTTLPSPRPISGQPTRRSRQRSPHRHARGRFQRHEPPPSRSAVGPPGSRPARYPDDARAASRRPSSRLVAHGACESAIGALGDTARSHFGLDGSTMVAGARHSAAAVQQQRILCGSSSAAAAAMDLAAASE